MNPDIRLIWLDLHGELRKFINHKVKDNAAVDDILQDVFIKVYLNVHQLKDVSKLTSWVYQIARNTINDHYKQAHESADLSSLELAVDEAQEPIYQSLSQCINSKILGLSNQDREAVLLTYFKDYSQKELAVFLGISYSGAKNRIQRAREKLRHSILDCEKVDSDSSGRITDFNS